MHVNRQRKHRYLLDVLHHFSSYFDVYTDTHTHTLTLQKNIADYFDIPQRRHDITLQATNIHLHMKKKKIYMYTKIQCKFLRFITICHKLHIHISYIYINTHDIFDHPLNAWLGKEHGGNYLSRLCQCTDLGSYYGGSQRFGRCL